MENEEHLLCFSIHYGTIEKKDINKHREKIKHFRELRHRVTEEKINSIVEHIFSEEKKK